MSDGSEVQVRGAATGCYWSMRCAFRIIGSAEKIYILLITLLYEIVNSEFNVRFIRCVCCVIIVYCCF